MIRGRARPTGDDRPDEPRCRRCAIPSDTWPSARPSFVRPTPTPLPTFLVYTVTPGDTLSSIVLMFRTTARSIAFWNRANHPSLDPDSPTYAPDRIQAGWNLFLVPDVELDPEDVPDPPSAAPSAQSPATPSPPTPGAS